ncbi:MAG: elongation factor P [Candidatus Nealsonbacteria bacterium DGGOD1a]|nr:MAG: elongation factor P [Candidatus Nealsonbacteria bacterium DGGOD1a]
MLNYFDLRKGVLFILDGQPYEVLEFQQIIKAQDATVIRTKVKNLITGKIVDRTFHKGDSFEETESERAQVKFIYNNRGKFIFCRENDSSKRFELPEEKIGAGAKFLVPNTILDGVVYEDEVISVTLPIKVQLRVKEAAPGVKGNRSQSGTKAVVLETGATIQAPLFVEQGDVLEINTETGEYTKRI